MNDIVTNSDGRRFRVKVVRKGDRWGRSNALTHDDEDPIVQFWDLTHADEYGHGEDGQMASSYYLSTLLDHPAGRGIDLHGGVPEWYLDAEALDRTYRVVCAILAGIADTTSLTLGEDR